MEDMRFIRSIDIIVLFLLSPNCFPPVCFQAAGPHVERCIAGFNVPCSQHKTGK